MQQQPPSLDVFRFAHVIEESSINNNGNNNNTNNGKSKSTTNNRSKFPPNTFRSYDGETSYSYLEQILAQEKQNNKAESWNKLEKNMKIQKLHAFAERFGKEHGFPVKEIRSLKSFFVDALEKGKLLRTKDVMYSKETREIASIPSLFFHADTRAFTLRNLDNKRVSTLKSLTPKLRAMAPGDNNNPCQTSSEENNNKETENNNAIASAAATTTFISPVDEDEDKDDRKMDINTMEECI